MQSGSVFCRPPVIDDGPLIWQFVRDSDGLDLNSPYCYLLLCKHNRETCAVAESESGIVGFVTGYLLPGRADTLFIWQIGVHPGLRGKGLATRLLLDLLRRESCRDVGYIESTVGPSNQASRALFEAFAQRLHAPLSEQTCFESALFPNGNHEPENRLRIGPFPRFHLP